MLTLAVVTYTMIGKEYVKLKDLTADFIKAGSKGSWNGHDIDIVLDKVLLKYSSLKIDWDKGAGEEWIRLYDDKYGIVCMMHCKIKIIFAKKIDLSFLNNVTVIKVSDFNAAEWKIDLNVIAESCPGLCWDASPNAVDPVGFSLLDLYFASV